MAQKITKSKKSIPSEEIQDDEQPEQPVSKNIDKKNDKLVTTDSIIRRGPAKHQIANRPTNRPSRNENQ